MISTDFYVLQLPNILKMYHDKEMAWDPMVMKLNLQGQVALSHQGSSLDWQIGKLTCASIVQLWSPAWLNQKWYHKRSSEKEGTKEWC